MVGGCPECALVQVRCGLGRTPAFDRHESRGQERVSRRRVREESGFRRERQRLVGCVGRLSDPPAPRLQESERAE